MVLLTHRQREILLDLVKRAQIEKEHKGGILEETANALAHMPVEEDLITQPIIFQPGDLPQGSEVEKFEEEYGVKGKHFNEYLVSTGMELLKGLKC